MCAGKFSLSPRGQLKVKPEELDLRDGEVFVKADPAQKLPLARVVARAGELIGRATTNPSFKDVEGKSFAAHFAEVEVDTWTGHVKITRYVAAHDSGTIINRLARRKPDQRRRGAGHRHGVHRGADHRSR